MQDGFSRTIDYARISVTDLCNLRCKYCLPNGCEKKSHSDILSLEQINEISYALSELGVEKQRITGGEPLVRRGILSLFQLMGENQNIKNLAVTTNGQNLCEYAKPLKEANVKSINISLDTLDAKKYHDLTGGGNVKNTLLGIEKAKELGFENLKLNAVLLKGINDNEVYDLARFSKGLDIPIRFIELMPFQNQFNYANKHFISSDSIVKLYNLQKLQNNTSRDKTVQYEFLDGTKVSFISAISHKFCGYCNRVRITADGKLINCLHHPKEYDLKPYITDREKLKEYIQKCVSYKPLEHNIEDGVLQTREMENIGG